MQKKYLQWKRHARTSILARQREGEANDALKYTISFYVLLFLLPFQPYFVGRRAIGLFGSIKFY